jgi:hypothetical protein
MHNAEKEEEPGLNENKKRCDRGVMQGSIGLGFGVGVVWK